ncbi:hypothetical protein [Ramlibacter pallidus]|uniref:Lipoprotein n=1 Tax=Ramlibacter pallidus TaxID=2780087 RepID=A0ABR9S087_9BURK|nr:hypothetical protein [Ramlibacter pallidus]MBE7366452.1 hypothetical protein [Ramlibacter pallidus]
MHLRGRPVILCLALAAVLSACGGGSVGVSVGDFDEDDPFAFHPPRSSGLPAAVTVSAATDPAFNGTYASANVWLSPVFRFGGDPQTCRFRFAGLPQAGDQRVLEGEIRYLPGTAQLHRVQVVINGFDFRLAGTAGASVDRAGHLVTFDGAVLTGVEGTMGTLTLTGTIPLRAADKPVGC